MPKLFGGYGNKPSLYERPYLPAFGPLGIIIESGSLLPDNPYGPNGWFSTITLHFDFHEEISF